MDNAGYRNEAGFWVLLTRKPVSSHGLISALSKSRFRDTLMNNRSSHATSRRVTYRLVVTLAVALVSALEVRAQTSFTGNSSYSFSPGFWSSNRWNRNTTDNGTYTSAYTASSTASFYAGNYTFTGAASTGTVNIGNVGLTNGANVTFSGTSGTLQTNNIARTLTVGAGSTLDFGFQTIANAGFVKEGAGVLALAGGSYKDGFTLNQGTVVLRGANALGGSGNSLTLQGGTLAASSVDRDFVKGTFGSFIIVSGNIQFGERPANVPLASNTASLTFRDNVSVSGGPRTFTIGSDASTTFTGNILGGDLNIQANAGTKGSIVLSGNNTYASTTLSSGTLRATKALSLPSYATAGKVIFNGGTLIVEVGGSGWTETELSNLIGNATKTSGALGIDTFAAFPNFIQGAAAYNLGALGLNVFGGRTLTLTANNTYSGDTNVSGSSSTLLVRNSVGSGTGSGNVTVGTFSTLGGNGTVGGNVALNGATIGSAGDTLTLNSNLTTTGASNVVSGSTVTVNGLTTVSSGTFTLNGVLNGSGNIAVASGASLVGNATISRPTTLSGGTLGTSGNTLTLGSTLSAGGNNTIATGVTVNVTGDTAISSGVFTVNGTLGGSGAKIVGTGATLKGSGTIGGPATIQAGGFLTPGNSPGVQTFTGNLTLAGTTVMEINGTDRGATYDGISLTTGAGQSLSYGGTLSLLFGAPITAGTYDLFALTTGVAQSGTFGNVSIGGTAVASSSGLAITAAGWSASLIDTQGTPATWGLVFNNASGDLTITAIPEPSAFAALAGAGMISFALYRRRHYAAKLAA